MALRDVLVYLDRSAHADTRLAVAAKLAAAHDAALIGLRVEVHMHVPEAFRASIRPELLEAQAQAIRDDTTRVEAAFKATVEATGVQGEWWPRDGGGIEEVVRSARYADIAVVGLPPKDHDEELPSDDLIHGLLFGSGRAVLVVPDPMPEADLGRHVALAWNSSRESSRALSDSMGILLKSERVSVITICHAKDADKMADLADAVAHLKRNGINAEAVHVEAADVHAGEKLIETAKARGADLLVMGAYGQSRMREMVLGGATWRVLRASGLPVLMAH